MTTSSVRVAADGTASQQQGGISTVFREGAGNYWIIYNLGDAPTLDEHHFSVMPLGATPVGYSIEQVGTPPAGANAPTGALGVELHISDIPGNTGAPAATDSAFLFKSERN